MLMFENRVEIGISEQSQKQKRQKHHLEAEGLLSGPNMGSLSGPSLVQQKIANLAQIITPQIIVSTSFKKPLFMQCF